MGWTAFRYGFVCYLLPFAFFFGPALLSQGSIWEIISTALTGVIGVFLLAAAIVGFLREGLSLQGRIAIGIAGACLLAQGLVSDVVGLVIAGFWLVGYGRWSK